MNIVQFKQAKGKWLECVRVPYGRKGVELEKREYRIHPKAPVGCIDEIKSYALGTGLKVDGLALVDGVEQETILICFKTGVQATLPKMKFELKPEWCKCGKEEFHSYPEDGKCSCGIHKHHVHCNCGGVLQIG